MPLSYITIFLPLNLQLEVYNQILLEDHQMSETHFQNYTKYKIKKQSSYKQFTYTIKNKVY